MDEARRLFKRMGMITSDGKEALVIKRRNEKEKMVPLDIWQLRHEGLTRLLDGEEFAVVLGHFAKHRGFKSNAKNQTGGNEPDENKKALVGMAALAEKLAAYRTVGELFAKDPNFAKQKRNKNGAYSHSIKREYIEEEMRVLFDTQRKFKSKFASSEFEGEIGKIAFYQRPLGSSEDKVGFCSLEPEEAKERRAPLASYSFELFRFISRLTNLRIESGRDIRPLSENEIAKAIGEFGTQKSITYLALRKRIGLREQDRFQGITPGNKKIDHEVIVKKKGKETTKKMVDYCETADVVARTKGTAPGTFTLRQIILPLGETVWGNLLSRPEILDEIAFVLSFNEDIAQIKARLQELKLDPIVFDALSKALLLSDDPFKDFKGAGNISALAARKLTPVMKKGVSFTDACQEIYGHDPRVETNVDAVRNPIARKGIGEVLKQVRTLDYHFGPFDRFHFELARDFAKSVDERGAIDAGIKNRTEQKSVHRSEATELLGRDPSGDELQRYEMFKEQQGRCPYCDTDLNPRWIGQGDNYLQVDHIMPWSRFGDDSFRNKVLVHVKCNQDKGNRTPYEWLTQDKSESDWIKFEHGIRANVALHKVKRANLLRKDAESVEEKFRKRNLNDTRYISRLVMNILAAQYPSATRNIRARPGALTGILRRCWGINSLKKDRATGKRLSDQRHHAIDAAVVAATPEWMLQHITEQAKKDSAAGKWPFAQMPHPWKGFRDQLLEKYNHVFVARGERRRGRGKGHDATIRQIDRRDRDAGKPLDEARVYGRLSIDKLSEDSLPLLKDSGDPRNAKTIAALRAWIDAGKPKEVEKLPRSPKGDIIRKVRIQTPKNKITSDLLINNGQVDRDNMIRVDIFKKPNKKGLYQYFLVPIYAYQIADKQRYSLPPEKAVPNGELIDASYDFVWSLYPGSYVKLVKASGEIVEGYYRNTDVATGSITLSPHNDSQNLIRSIGIKTLREFRKYCVDRMGQLAEIRKEKQTWHGKVCT